MVLAVALSGDGRYAVSGSDDHTLRVWNLTNGASVETFTCEGTVICCGWPQAHVVAGDIAGRIYLFDWEE